MAGLGLGGIVAGFIAAGTVAGGTAFLDTALTTGFGGAVLASIASTGARNPLNAALRRGPLAFYGRVSYGLYMTHIMVFVYFGWFDRRMDRLWHRRQPGQSSHFDFARAPRSPPRSGMDSNRAS